MRGDLRASTRATRSRERFTTSRNGNGPRHRGPLSRRRIVPSSRPSPPVPNTLRPTAPLRWLARRLWDSVPTLEPVTSLRLTLYLGGLGCFGGVQMLGGYMRAGLNHQVGVTAMCALLIAGMALLFFAVRSTIPRVLHRLAPLRRVLLAGGLFSTLLLAIYGIGEVAQFGDIATPHHYQNDAVTNTYCAAQLLIHGHNPYTDFNMADCLIQNGLNGRFTTPLQAGAFANIKIYPTRPQLLRHFAQDSAAHILHPTEFESYVSYPAGAFVFIAPFVALGWHDMSSFFLIWILLSYLLLAFWTTRRFMFWLVPIALGNIALVGDVVSGSSESLDNFLILAGWATWRRPWLSAVLMGMAVACRQQAWFVAIFYAILIWRTDGWRALAQRIAVMAVIFSALNLPFFIQSPAAWIDGALGPLKDPMFPLGAGIIALAVHDWLPLWPRATYLGFELIAMVACALYYARHCRCHPHTGLVLALVPLAFAWRSLFTYFMPLPIFCLWPVLAGMKAIVDKKRDDGSDSTALLLMVQQLEPVTIGGLAPREYGRRLGAALRLRARGMVNKAPLLSPTTHGKRARAQSESAPAGVERR